MGTQQNKEIVRRFFEEVMNRGRLEVAGEIFGEELREDLWTETGAGRLSAAIFRSAFPDIRFEVEDLVAEGDEVVVRVTFEGTHTGDFLGIPATGKRVRASGVELARLRDGKIVEEGWHYYDELQLLRQLGVLHGSSHGNAEHH